MPTFCCRCGAPWHTRCRRRVRTATSSRCVAAKGCGACCFLPGCSYGQGLRGMLLRLACLAGAWGVASQHGGVVGSKRGCQAGWGFMARPGVGQQTPAAGLWSERQCSTLHFDRGIGRHPNTTPTASPAAPTGHKRRCVHCGGVSARRQAAGGARLASHPRGAGCQAAAAGLAGAGSDAGHCCPAAAARSRPRWGGDGLAAPGDGSGSSGAGGAVPGSGQRANSGGGS